MDIYSKQKKKFEFVLVFISTLVLMVSLVIISVLPHYVNNNYYEFGERLLWGCLGFLVCCLLISLIIKYNIFGWRRFLSPISSGLSTLNGKVLLGCFLFTFIALVFLSTISDKPTPPFSSILNWDGFIFILRQANQNPGGIFNILVAIVTFIGFYYTYRGLHDQQRVIHSFSDLMDRLTQLGATLSKDNHLKVIAYTPAIGFLARPMTEWVRLKASIEATIQGEGTSLTEFVCLDEDSLNKWHGEFAGRKTQSGDIHITDDRIKEANNASRNIIRRLREDTTQETVFEFPWEYLPGYYLFFTREKAIIVTPLFLPFKVQDKLDISSIQQGLPAVQMIGIETEDRLIIAALEDQFDCYKKLHKEINKKEEVV